MSTEPDEIRKEMTLRKTEEPSKHLVFTEEGELVLKPIGEKVEKPEVVIDQMCQTGFFAR